ncbi:MAG: hypothetical protein HYY46_24675 [Deltaproteobacteria bacterium]|nr:hypothetical protein [Deltaproteobacteria bacterium]
MITWALTSWLWSHRPQSSAEIPVRALYRKGDYPDDPITRDDEDLLGRVVFVDRLFEQVLSVPSPQSFVFGLYGGWGEGKTSVLNLLQKRLAQDPNTVTVVFNPWYLATEAALIQAFYAAIEGALQSRYALSRLHGTIKRYKQFLTFGLRYFGFYFPTKDDPERLRTELESWIVRLDCRTIIIIDDIDRLQADEMLAVFKIARLSARLRNSVFLLSFDPLTVIDRLKIDNKAEPEFLEKIIQKPVRLPPAEQRDIDRFLFYSDPGGPESHRSAIDHLLDELRIDPWTRKEFDNKMTFFYQTRLRRLFRTMRHAKRYLNALRASLPPIVGEVNVYDFFLLEARQVFSPRIYRDIWSSPWYYLPNWAPEIFLTYPFALITDADEKYRLIRKHIQKLLDQEPEKDLAKELLEELFFVQVKDAFSDHFMRSDQSGLAQRHESEKRVTHPKCFPRYFMFKLPTGEFGDRLIEELIEKWNSASDPQDIVYDDLHRYIETGQLVQIFEKLRIFRQLISPVRVPAIVRVLSRLSSDLSLTSTEPWSSERDRASSLLLQLVEDRTDPDEIQPLVQEVVGEATSIPFAVSIVYESGTRGSGSYFHIYEKINIASLRKLACKRLTDYFVEGKRDIFEELSGRDLPFVLYQWATNWNTDDQENRPVVQKYAISLMDSKPEYLGRLLSHFRTRTISGEYSGFDFEAFRKAFDSSVIEVLLSRYGDAALTTPEAKEATELFNKHYAVYKASGAEKQK